LESSEECKRSFSTKTWGTSYDLINKPFSSDKKINLMFSTMLHQGTIMDRISTRVLKQGTFQTKILTCNELMVEEKCQQNVGKMVER